MFYIKHKGDKLEIQEDNVYTQCGRCGRELHVDITEILSSNDGDLYGTSLYCHACSVEYAKEHRGEEWAEQLMREDERE